LRQVEGVVGQAHGTTTYTVSDNGVLNGARLVEGHPNEGTETAYPNEKK